MITVGLAVVLGLTLVAPHVLRFETAAPVAAGAIWLSALVLRAAIAITTAVVIAVIAPATAVFHALTHLCWDTILPLLRARFELSGHALADIAILLPAALLVWWGCSVIVGLHRAARRVRRLLAGGLGPGPQDSVIVGGDDVILAAAGLRRPRVIVSAGALARLEDAELRAGLDHEHGHIDRRHRWILVVAELSSAIGRVVPGSRSAMRELTFHLERDADRFALRRHNSRGDLASVICKAAEGGGTAASATALAGNGVVRRVSQLLDEEPRERSSLSARVVAGVMISCVVVFATIAGPATVAAAESVAAHAPLPALC